MERYFFVFIEEHQDAHLVGRNRHLISSGPVVSNSGSDFSISLVEFPVELSAWKLGHVILFVDVHAVFDDSGDGYDVKLLQRLVLCRWISAFIWPVTCSEYFHIQINVDSCAALTLFEVLHSLLRHLDVFVHYFQSLCEVETTLLFQLLDDFLFSIFKYSSAIKKSLRKTSFVVVLEHIFVL